MRLCIRKDFGGYAAGLTALERVSQVEIKKPFVLLCGPNGSGKTALIKALRLSLGLVGLAAGRVASKADMEECPLDILHRKTAKAAPASKNSPLEGRIRDFPALLDIEALGWKGERTWLFDSRRETVMADAASFDGDFHYHFNMVQSGGTNVSHGQMLRLGWEMALQWASGIRTVADPYDMSLRGRHLDLWRKATGMDGASPETRPQERWLLLDEPEVALDIEAQMAGFALLLHKAEIGKLRVFCASHSPLFAAGLGDHPKVQVIDLDPNPNRSWYACLRKGLQIASSPEKTDAMGEQILALLDENHRKELEADRKRKEQANQKAIKAAAKLGKTLKSALVATLDHPEYRLPHKINGQHLTGMCMMPLVDKGLVDRTHRLTDAGHVAVQYLIVDESWPCPDTVEF